jgi:beta-RFAP synthase
LHFGLLALHPDAERRFGGVGVMVQRPGIHLHITPAKTLTVQGLLAERAAQFARTLLNLSTPALPLRGARIDVLCAPPEHIGLGTGTQLAFAVGRGLLALAGHDGVSTRTLAVQLDRGKRSAIGLHGFAQGGLLVDAGKRADERIAPIVSRLPICRDWRFVLVIPRALRGIHGPREVRAFDQMPSMPLSTTRELCTRVLTDLLPAAVQRDVQGFGEAVYDLNRRVGEAFASQQGGVYAGQQLTNIVEFIRAEGVAGVGQSSWGPTIFAIVADDDEADALARKVRMRMSLDADEVIVTEASNDGASIENVATVTNRVANHTSRITE